MPQPQDTTVQPITQPSLENEAVKSSHLETVFTVITGIIVAIAIFFRFWKLGNIPGINGDEAFFGLASQSLLRHQSIPWKTPTGNPLDLFYLIPSLILQMFFQPSAALLRTPAVISGVLAVVFAAVYWKRLYGKWNALVYVALIAVLPENIIQSRLGWEPSQSVLATEIVLFCSLMALADVQKSTRWLVGAGIALVCAVMCHPSNIFIAVFFFGALIANYQNRLANNTAANVSGSKAMAMWAAMIASVVAVLIWRWNYVQKGIDTLTTTNSAEAFPIFYARLINGITGLRYITTSWYSTNRQNLDQSIALLTYATLAVIAVCGIEGLILSLNKRANLSKTDKVLFIGWAVMMLGYLVIGGANALTPGNERYGLVLIAPTVLVVCRALELATKSSKMLRDISALVILGISGAFLVMFYKGYFAAVEHPIAIADLTTLTFLSGPVEPKEAAWKIIESENSQPDHYGIVIAKSWHNTAPLKYFNNGNPKSKLVVLAYNQIDSEDSRRDIQVAEQSGRVWFVDFAMSSDRVQTENELKAANVKFTEQVVYGYDQMPIEVVIHVTGANAPV